MRTYEFRVDYTDGTYEVVSVPYGTTITDAMAAARTAAEEHGSLANEPFLLAIVDKAPQAALAFMGGAA